ncbi:hypothetical protein HMPREF0673_00880 [Leyella stercorea DSM 18206]|uniref:Uncharacterized protein n=1 Tax=Leyella stercorea DSM 18206 TaxID=1002367 RepID=G6AW82_9BACT|nr:hypothetical protein HMPREF0673_00880 [Leyella stercorea DSM 18206]
MWAAWYGQDAHTSYFLLFYFFTLLLLNKKESMFHTYMQLRMEHTLNILFQK